MSSGRGRLHSVGVGPVKKVDAPESNVTLIQASVEGISQYLSTNLFPHLRGRLGSLRHARWLFDLNKVRVALIDHSGHLSGEQLPLQCSWPHRQRSGPLVFTQISHEHGRCPHGQSTWTCPHEQSVKGTRCRPKNRASPCWVKGCRTKDRAGKVRVNVCLASPSAVRLGYCLWLSLGLLGLGAHFALRVVLRTGQAFRRRVSFCG